MARQHIQLCKGDKIDRWVVEEKLGEGGFGAVYRVFRIDFL